MKQIYVWIGVVAAVAFGSWGPLRAEEAILGPDADACKAGSDIAAILVRVTGFKDREGQVRVELYSDKKEDFLDDRKELLARHAVFKRIDVPTPDEGPAEICVEPPGPGQYTLVALHDRNHNGKFTLFKDGVGFSNNPRIGLSKPSVEKVIFPVGKGVTALTVILNYMRGFSPRPVDNPQ